MCTEYKPGTPGRTPGNSQGRTGQGGTNSRPAYQRAEPKQQRPHLPPNVQNFTDMDSEPENKG
jgi:hypothetical protein